MAHLWPLPHRGRGWGGAGYPSACLIHSISAQGLPMIHGKSIETPADRIPAVVLGATGLVGQRLVAMLARHPWFRLAGVAASERHAGRLYGEVVQWRIEGAVPPEAAALRLARPTPNDCPPATLVFSALPALEAEAVEPTFARAGAFVSSNASAFRMRPDVPLV